MIRDLGLKPDFSGVDPAVMSNAALRGKLVEGYCYRLLRGEKVTIREKHCGSLYAGVSDRVTGFYRWMEKYKPVYMDHQTIAWDLADGVAWTRDCRVRINSKLWLVDIKCTASIAQDWPLQLGCGLAYDEDGCDSAAILRLGPKLNKSGFQWRKPWSGAKLIQWWKRAVGHWHGMRDFNALRAELGFSSEAVGFETEDEEYA